MPERAEALPVDPEKQKVIDVWIRAGTTWPSSPRTSTTAAHRRIIVGNDDESEQKSGKRVPR